MTRRDLAGALTCLVLVVALGLLALAGLRTEPGPVLAARTTNVELQDPLPPLTPDGVLEQELPGFAPGLTRVSGTFATYGGVTRCAVRASLLAPGGAVVASRDLPCADLPDNQPVLLLEVDPLEDSEGALYTLRLESLPEAGPDLVSLWGGPIREGARAVRSAGYVLDATGVVTTEYAAPGDTAALVRLWLERVALGAPWYAAAPAVVAWAAAAALAAAAIAGLAVAGRWRAGLAALAVVAVAKGLLWAAVIPPLEGMDEGSHVAYAQFVAEDRRVPVRDEPYDGRPNPYSLQIDVLTRDMHVFSIRPTDRRDYTEQAQRDLERELAAASPVSNGAGPASGYPPTYYAPAALAAAVTPGTLVDDVHAMRLWSVALGVAAAVLAAIAAGQLLPRHRGAALLVGLAAALHPMATHQTSIVNNDALVVAAGAGALACAAALARRGPSPWLALAGGVAAGSALLAKPFGAAAVAVVGLGLLIGAGHARRWRQLPAGIAAAVAGAALSYGPWVLAQRVFGWSSTTLPTGDDPGDRSLGRFLALQLAGDPPPWREQWVEQYWGNFSWVDTPYPEEVYGALTTVLAVALALAGVALLVAPVVQVAGWSQRRRAARPPAEPADGSGPAAAAGDRVDGPAEDPVGDGEDGEVGEDGEATPGRPQPPDARPALGLLLCAGSLVATLAVLYAAGYLYFLSSGRNDLLQGRYALLTLPCLLALPVLAAASLVPRAARGPLAGAVAALVAAGVAALHVWAVSLLAERFYL